MCTPVYAIILLQAVMVLNHTPRITSYNSKNIVLATDRLVLLNI